MSLVKTLDALVKRIAGQSSYERCDAVANVSRDIFTTQEGGFISSFNFAGSMRFIAEDDIKNFSESIDNALKDLFRAEGHCLSFYLDRSASNGNQLLKNILNTSNKSLNRLGFKSPIPKARKKHLSGLLQPFNITLTITTRLTALSEQERQSILDEHYQGLQNAPKFKPDQSQLNAIGELLNKHLSFTKAFKTQLGKICLLQEISCDETLYRAHDALYRVSARGNKKNFQLLPQSYSIRRSQKQKENGLTAPSIAEQILNEDLMPMSNDASMVRVGENIFAPLYLPHAPFDPKPLANLLELIDQVPFRMAVHVLTGNQSVKSTANLLTSRARNFKIFDDNNKDIYKAGEYFLNQLKRGDCGVNASFSFVTWAKDKKALRRNREIMAAAISSWGGCSTHYERGDTIDALLATIPLFGSRSKSPPKHPWLFKDLVALLPFSVSAPLFKNPDLTLILPNGQNYPLEFGSPLLKSYSMLIAAESGSGKSSFLTNILNSLLFRPSVGGRFPPIGVIDNGLAQTFWAQTIYSALPKELHYLVQCVTPTHAKEDAMNFLVLPLGVSMPPLSQKEFAAGFLQTLLTEPGSSEHPAGMTGLCSALVLEAYRKFESSEQRIYNPGNQTIDHALKENGFHYDIAQPVSFYQIRDQLFDAGQIEAAYVAQTFAVPTLLDLVRIVNDSTHIRTNYGNKRFYGEDAISYVSSTINNIAEQFPALAHRSVHNWQASKVRIINLQIAAPKAAESDPITQKTSSLFYGIAWNALFGEYFMRAKEVEAICPQRYMKYQMQRLSDLESTLKCAFVDEYHRASKLNVINNNVLQIEKEGRARKIFGCFISQALTPDFPDEIINQASSIVVLGLPSKDGVVKAYRKFLHYSDQQDQAIRRHLATAFHPKWGSSCLIYFEYKGGTLLQLAYIPSPAEEVWQITTSNSERALVNFLSRYMPQHLTLEILAKEFNFDGASFIDNFAGRQQITVDQACEAIGKQLLKKYQAMDFNNKIS